MRKKIISAEGREGVWFMPQKKKKSPLSAVEILYKIFAQSVAIVYFRKLGS